MNSSVPAAVSCALFVTSTALWAALADAETIVRTTRVIARVAGSKLLERIVKDVTYGAARACSRSASTASVTLPSSQPLRLPARGEIPKVTISSFSSSSTANDERQVARVREQRADVPDAVGLVDAPRRTRPPAR